MRAKRDLSSYYHECCFSPVSSTLIKEIENGNFCTWPVLTVTAVHKYLQTSIATVKGYMKQQRKKYGQPEKKWTLIRNRKRQKITGGTGECYVTITPIAETGEVFSDQTGRFPITSSKGNKYIIIMYNYNSNYIPGEAMKFRMGDEILRAFRTLHE